MSKQKDDDGVKVTKEFTLSKADVATFTNAVERRIGKKSYEDWRLIGRIYKKASDAALNESGANSRQSPAYKKVFSRIIADLPPIAGNESTAKNYRAALLHIECNDEAFGKWYDKHQPRAANPLDWWHEFRDATKPESETEASGDKPERFSKHQREIAQLKQNYTDKISALTDENAALKNRNAALDSDQGEWQLLWNQYGRDFDTLVSEMITFARSKGYAFPDIKSRIEAVLRRYSTEATGDAA